MNEKIGKLIQSYTDIRNQSRVMMAITVNEEDEIKLKAGIVTFDLVIEDLAKLLKDSD